MGSDEDKKPERIGGQLAVVVILLAAGLVLMILFGVSPLRFFG